MSNGRQLLHLLARPALGTGERERARRLARSADWENVAAQARAAAVGGLVHRSLERDLPDIDVPAGARRALAASYRATLADNLWRLRIADEVLDALAARRVDAIVLKGALLVETHYRDPGVRPMRDVDLLVRPEAIAEADEALRALGFARLRTPRREQSSEAYYQRGYERGSDKVELHIALCDTDRYRADVAGLWARSVPISWRGRAARALDGPDHLAYVALHAALHGFLLPLTCLVDVATITGAEPTLAGAAAIRARSWGATAAVHLGLSLARALCGAPVDDGVLASLRPGTLRSGWLRFCFHADRMPAFRWGGSLRVAQALTLLPLMEDGRGAYLAKYARLRWRDAWSR